MVLYTTGNSARLEFDLNAYKTELEVQDALDKVEYRGGNTNTTGGLYLARTRILAPQYGARPNTTHIIILITDGIPTYDEDKLQDEVDKIKAEDIKLIAIGVTNLVIIDFTYFKQNRKLCTLTTPYFVKVSESHLHFFSAN